MSDPTPQQEAVCPREATLREALMPFIFVANNIPAKLHGSRYVEVMIGLTPGEIDDLPKINGEPVRSAKLNIALDGLNVEHFRALERAAATPSPEASGGDLCERLRREANAVRDSQEDTEGVIYANSDGTISVDLESLCALLITAHDAATLIERYERERGEMRFTATVGIRRQEREIVGIAELLRLINGGAVFGHIALRSNATVTTSNGEEG